MYLYLTIVKIYISKSKLDNLTFPDVVDNNIMVKLVTKTMFFSCIKGKSAGEGI
jgi:hypothetical protein